jgi:hypothetical protein
MINTQQTNGLNGQKSQTPAKPGIRKAGERDLFLILDFGNFFGKMR